MALKITGLTVLVIGLLIAGLAVFLLVKRPIMHSQLDSDTWGEVVTAAPLWGSHGLTVVFADPQKFTFKQLSQRLAELGLTAVIIDSKGFLARFTDETELCLSGDLIGNALQVLTKQLSLSSSQRLWVVGIGEGALIPFLNALSATDDNVGNVSIGFSVKLPVDLNLCPPVLSQQQGQDQILVSAPEIEGSWRAVWSDQPDDKTGVFIRTLGNIDTRIAPYNTPLDELLLDELNTASGHNDKAVPPLPVVEVPSSQAKQTVTLFYSGDGGWRDLDRTVAEEMAAQNYPVVGVDVLRYFWEHKTPEQAAVDLSATMAFYRKQWGVKSFVLAGYSFGADILPAIYNRLPVENQDSVTLLVLLALAEHADFEIHVSGWLGEKGGELAISPELSKIPQQKVLCVYGVDEKAESACTALQNSEATILELPGGHHFDQNYPKLTGEILSVYRRHGID